MCYLYIYHAIYTCVSRMSSKASQRVLARDAVSGRLSSFFGERWKTMKNPLRLHNVLCALLSSVGFIKIVGAWLVRKKDFFFHRLCLDGGIEHERERKGEGKQEERELFFLLFFQRNVFPLHFHVSRVTMLRAREPPANIRFEETKNSRNPRLRRRRCLTISSLLFVCLWEFTWNYQIIASSSSSIYAQKGSCTFSRKYL